MYICICIYIYIYIHIYIYVYITVDTVFHFPWSLQGKMRMHDSDAVAVLPQNMLGIRARLLGPGMGANHAPASVAIELARTWFTPRQQGISLSELRSELHTGRCPQPAEVSVSVINLLYAFSAVGTGLFLLGICIGIGIAAPLAAIVARRRPPPLTTPDTATLRLTGGSRGIAA